MRSPFQDQDPTAGTRACEIREHPEVPQPIHDPTDPRFGEVLSGAREHGGATELASDATDPLYGQTSG
ncbi:MAG: hypothetical protein JO321_09160 [Solirubrobacterales bacterium]|nr:hypothetical protein [Solirubrobacterales bacterium]